MSFVLHMIQEKKIDVKNFGGVGVLGWGGCLGLGVFQGKWIR